MKEKPIKVGISIGDMNGIGLEIILKTFEDHQILELCTPIIFASNKLVSFQNRRRWQICLFIITSCGGSVKKQQY